jgi:zinc transport system substrate-binding protein
MSRIKNTKLKFLVSLCLGVTFIVLTRCAPEKPPSNKLDVFASILPQKYFLDAIGKNIVTVTIMVEPGSSPHTYEPRPSQMVALSKAKAYFSIGVGFENAWLPKFAALAKNLRIVRTDTLITKIPADSAEREGGRREEGMDPHIWLSPQLVKQQARTIHEALRAIDPAHGAAYDANFLAFNNQIVSLQDTLRALLGDSAMPKRVFMVFHPAWGYFAREFNLRQIAIEVNGKEPSPRELESIITTAKLSDIHTIFVQPQFSQQSANAIARQLHARLCVADDLAYDWAANLMSVAKTLAAR